MIVRKIVLAMYALFVRLKLSPVPVRMPLSDTIGDSNEVQPIIIEHKTLDELNKIDPYEFPVSTLLFSSHSMKERSFYVHYL